ncbi:MAG: leucyl aminopeptidase [Alphaproteobacteria bacterium]|nr:leucyl aminopeptidase [Alphaproteobacteria bacterium]
MLKVSFGKPTRPRGSALVVFAFAGGKLLPAATALDRETGGALTRAAKGGRWNGKTGEVLPLIGLDLGEVSRVLVVGLGDSDGLDRAGLEKAGSAIARTLLPTGVATAAIHLDALGAKAPPPAEAAAAIAFGAAMRAYSFDTYRTRRKPEETPALASLAIGVEDAAGARKAWEGLVPLVEGIFFTRDLVSEPANILYPEEFVNRLRPLTKLGLTLEVLGEKEMRRLGMGALLGVAQGSVREPRLAVLVWNGGASGEAPLAVVGKGVCFDTGGISLKPPAGMEDMKWDMGGAGVVAGLMRTLAARKARANVVGVLGLVENMPDGNAQRPGDVVTAMDGQTIEVINTDAEGRLVLADAVTYVQQTYKPRAIVDLATLTGAIIISLGHEYAGLFSNDDGLAEALLAAGKAEGEGIWRMPMGEVFDRKLTSQIADMKNVGPREGGSITAAQFIKRFIKDGTPWAHLDIAGTVWINEARTLHEKGATGYGVRLLNRLVADGYEGGPASAPGRSGGGRKAAAARKTPAAARRRKRG